jgi:hypothetical protein
MPLYPPQIPLTRPGHRGGKPATNRFSYGAAGYLLPENSTVIRTSLNKNVYDCQNIESRNSEVTKDGHCYVTVG